MRRLRVVHLPRAVTVAFIAAGLLIAGCAHPRFVVPSGPGIAAPEAADAWTEAAAPCRALHAYSAELRVSGRAGSEKLNATVLAGLTADDHIRLEMPAPFGRPVFVLAGPNAQSVLLTRDNRALTAPADQIIEA